MFFDNNVAGLVLIPLVGSHRCLSIKKNHDKNVSGLVLIPLVGSRGCLIVGSFLLVLTNLLTYWQTNLP